MNEQPKIKIWISRNLYNFQISVHETKPNYNPNGFFYVSTGLIAVQTWANKTNQFPNLKPGECKQFEITFREID